MEICARGDLKCVLYYSFPCRLRVLTFKRRIILYSQNFESLIISISKFHNITIYGKWEVDLGDIISTVEFFFTVEILVKRVMIFPNEMFLNE